MKAKLNDRLKEIKLSVAINHIDKAKSLITYRKLLKILSCLALAISTDANNRLSELAQISVCDGLARATDKELYATLSTFFKVTNAAKKLGITNTTFYRRYGDLMERNYITEEYLDSLQPIFNDPESKLMVNIVNRFIDNFKLPKMGNTNNDLEDRERTLELDFMIVYERLVAAFGNIGVVDKFIYNICIAFNIDFATISALKNNMHIINRTYPKFKYNNVYIMQEIFTLYTYRGYKKGSVGTKVLQRANNFMFSKSAKNYSKVIPKEDLDWQYARTVDWDNLDKESVKRFIKLLHDFSDYDV